MSHVAAISRRKPGIDLFSVETNPEGAGRQSDQTDTRPGYPLLSVEYNNTARDEPGD